MMQQPAVVAKDLTKSYKGQLALKKVGFQIENGELFGFIGPDGAGKTTLFHLLTTLLIPDTGSATVRGFDTVADYAAIRKIVGYMPGRFSLYQDLTVEENLNFFAGIFHTTIAENYHLIEDIYKQIEPFKTRRAGKLSGGMKQKLALSCALIHKPEVLFLDEPTTGVDAVSRMEFWEMLRKLKQQGITIVVSTPYMDEAALCDRVALMQNGEIMLTDTPQGIVDGFKGELLAVSSDAMFDLLHQLEALPNTAAAYRFGDRIHYVSQGKADQAAMLKSLAESGQKNIVIQPITPVIEDCFIMLMKSKTKNEPSK
jgi:ABC-type multidrug transport system ATPase subunit